MTTAKERKERAENRAWMEANRPPSCKCYGADGHKVGSDKDSCKCQCHVYQGRNFL